MVAFRYTRLLVALCLVMGCQSAPLPRAVRQEPAPLKAPAPYTSRYALPTVSSRSPAGERYPGLFEEPPIKPLRLREAIEISLQNSDVVKTVGRGVARTANVTAYDPSILSRQVTVEQAEFDPTVSVNLLGGQFDEPSDTPGSAFRSSTLNRQETNVTARLSKKWTPGTETSLAYAPPLAYLYLPAPSSRLLNPVIGSAVVLEARQPLLKGAGQQVNEAPIRIAQLQWDQSNWDFKSALLEQVRNIEEAYWSLQASYTTLQALDQILPLLEDAVRIEELRLQVEQITVAEVARVRLQRNEFLQERVRVLADIQEQEYALRTLLGLPVESRQQFVPIEPPRVTGDDLTLDQALTVAMEHRPDIVQRRLQLRVRELQYEIAKNRANPQWDLTALYRASGISDQFEETFDQIAASQYTDWTVGMEFSVPLGNRAARSNRVAAEERLYRERATFQQHINNVSYQLADLIRDLKATAQEYELAREQVGDSEAWVKIARIRFSSPPPAGRSKDWLLVALDDYQFALRRHIDAVTEASQLLGEFNSLVARLGEAQGTLLDQRLVELEDDPIDHVQSHAPVWFDNRSPAIRAPHGWSTQ